MKINNLVHCEAEEQCKVCGGVSTLYGVTDFNRNCSENNGVFLPLCGVPIYYHQCVDCGLIFTVAFDKWSKEDYLTHIYNDEYVKVDPEYLEVRPRSTANLVYGFIKDATHLQLLDYGGGNGKMSRLLEEKGISCQSWDPMGNTNSRPEKRHFDLVTAFEVLEHTPTPQETAEDALNCLNETGVFLFSTLTVDNLPPRSIHFWYIGPRNGHITIHTKKSLAVLFSKHGYKVHHFNENMHLAFRDVPSWLT